MYSFPFSLDLWSFAPGRQSPEIHLELLLWTPIPQRRQDSCTEHFWKTIGVKARSPFSGRASMCSFVSMNHLCLVWFSRGNEPSFRKTTNLHMSVIPPSNKRSVFAPLDMHTYAWLCIHITKHRKYYSCTSVIFLLNMILGAVIHCQLARLERRRAEIKKEEAMVVVEAETATALVDQPRRTVVGSPQANGNTRSF